ncbi:MAG: hypothetical protein JNK09_03865 [Prolixibacteraceae bacterium]|nr:hypothetical protein [Prolixibacteraceae bacterium]
MKHFLFLLLTILSCCLVSAQQNSGKSASDYDYSKNGVLILEPFQNFGNIKKADSALYNKQLETIKTFVNQMVVSSALLTEKRGFDLNVAVNGHGNMDEPNKWQQKDFEYGIITELCFQFQLFYIKGGKWANYCPNWCFKLNAPLYGKSLPFESLHSNNKVLNESFLVFPKVKELAPGVRFYHNDAGKGELVFFNPNRPDFWLPVTVKEIVDARLKYTAENEKEVYEIMKTQVDKLSEAELNEPAYFQRSDENFLIDVNGKKEGIPVMRFNPDYWDRSLPRSDIQFFTLNYFEIHDENKWNSEREKFFKSNNGRIDYIREAPLSITDFKKLSAVIQKK